MSTLAATGIRLKTFVQEELADLHTPISLYLKARDRFQAPVMLENNDFRSKEDCYSYIGLDPLASFRVEAGQITLQFPDGSQEKGLVLGPQAVPTNLQAFLKRFEVEQQPGIFNGLIGFTGFDGVQYFDKHEPDPQKRKMQVPELCYHLYRFILAFDHFRDRLTILENCPEGEASQMHRIELLLSSKQARSHPFQRLGTESSNLTDAAFMELVRKGKEHCQLGDVFQIVFSRQYAQGFKGDDFNVYRALRSINPSPYLFYADFGNFRIFGSSPETQMAVKEGVATVNPIAGTYRRSGHNQEDIQQALGLSSDPKENAEHIMLVDLARNDLSRHARNVRVEELKTVQFFSHVIHLVSKVAGDLAPDTNTFQVFADTFPAGTLSGAPKYKAIELIHQYENQNRGIYGGALGYIDFNGEMNTAILIRTFLSQHNTLYYQAGAGIVVASDPEKELQEVKNKLGALTKAILHAEALSLI